MTRYIQRGGRRSRVRSRAYVLIYILGLIPLLAVVATLTLKGTASILRSQQAAAVRTSEFAAMNDWVDMLRKDTRRASAVALAAPSDDGDPTVIDLTLPEGKIRYTVSGGDIEREVQKVGHAATSQRWTLRSMTVTVEATETGDLLRAVVEWRRVHGRRLEAPPTQFETLYWIGRSHS